MGMQININVLVFNVYCNLFNMQNDLLKLFEKFLSGLCINCVVDDVVGLVIFEGLCLQVNGLNVVVCNVQDGILVIQIVEGVLIEVYLILQCVCDLINQGVNDLNNVKLCDVIQKEINIFGDEFIWIVDSINFNGIKLFLGGMMLMFQVGVGVVVVEDQILVVLIDFDIFGVDIKMFVVIMIDVVSYGVVLVGIDMQIQVVLIVCVGYGVLQNCFELIINSFNVLVENFLVVESCICDIDMVFEMVKFMLVNILLQVGMVMFVQVNQVNQGVLQLLC